MMNLLGDLLKNRNLNSTLVRGVKAAQIVAAAEKILIDRFGEGIKNSAAPAYFKNQILSIACLSSSAASEIKLHESSILEDLNKAVPGAQVVKIRYLS